MVAKYFIKTALTITLAMRWNMTKNWFFLILITLLLFGCSNEETKTPVTTKAPTEKKTEVNSKEETQAEEIPLLYKSYDGSTNYYINNKAELAFLGTYTNARPFSEGLAYVEDFAGNSYFINTSGEKAFTVDYEEVGDFHNGLARVMIFISDQEGNQQGRYGFIDKEGNIIINPIYYNATEFSEDKALGIEWVASEGIWKLVLISTNGETKDLSIGVGHMSDISPFSEGFAFVYPSKYTNSFLINKEGEIISDKYSMFMEMKSGVAPALKEDEQSENYLWGLINKKGIEVLTPQFYDIVPFHTTVTFAKQLGDISFGLIDLDGNWIKKDIYKEVGEFSEGLAPVLIEGTYWGYINEKGEEVIKAQFEDASPFIEGIARVVVSGKVGYINRNGQYVLPLGKEPTGDFNQDKNEATDMPSLGSIETSNVDTTDEEASIEKEVDINEKPLSDTSTAAPEINLLYAKTTDVIYAKFRLTKPTKYTQLVDIPAVVGLDWDLSMLDTYYLADNNIFETVESIGGDNELKGHVRKYVNNVWFSEYYLTGIYEFTTPLYYEEYSDEEHTLVRADMFFDGIDLQPELLLTELNHYLGKGVKTEPYLYEWYVAESSGENEETTTGRGMRVLFYYNTENPELRPEIVFVPVY